MTVRPTVGRARECPVTSSSTFLHLHAPAAVVASVLAFPLSASAAPDTSLGSVVVTATRSDTPVERALADVSILDRQTIEDAGASTLPELLRSAGGIEIAQNGGAGSVSGLFLRGARNAQTLVLVDGIRIENPASGGALLEFLPLSAIDRIEILKAPASSLYGSAAVAGVVQIFTRRPVGDGLRPFASVGFGSRGTQRLQTGFSARGGDSAVSLSLARERTEGFDATAPGSPSHQADRDGNRVGSLTASFEHRLTSQWRIGANLLASDGRVDYDDAFSTPDSARMDYRSSAFSAFANGWLAGNWETTLRAGVSAIDYSLAAFSFSPRTESRTLAWENFIEAGGARWQFGVETVAQSIAGEGFTQGDFIYARDSRDTDSVFGGWERPFGDHLLRLTMRHDRIEAVGSQTSGSVGWGWQLTPEWLLRAGWGSAFRAPTFDDLYNPWSPNPTLRPERSTGIELAAEWRRGGDLVKAMAFSNRIRDAIELDAFFAAQNLEVATVKGLTLEARRTLGALTLRGSITVQRPRAERLDPATGEMLDRDLARRARRHAALGASWQQGPWRFGADAIAQSRRVDTDGTPMAGYAFMDLWGSYRIDRRWQLFGRLGNLADREYETAAGYRAAPRSLFVGIRYEGS